jgi:hypothetical protein
MLDLHKKNPFENDSKGFFLYIKQVNLRLV